jgi:hypothetical protein
MVNSRSFGRCVTRAQLVLKCLNGLELSEALCVLGCAMTEMLEQLDPDERAEIMADWLTTLSAVVSEKDERHAAEARKQSGDDL